MGLLAAFLCLRTNMLCGTTRSVGLAVAVQVSVIIHRYHSHRADMFPKSRTILKSLVVLRDNQLHLRRTSLTPYLFIPLLLLLKRPIPAPFAVEVVPC